MTLLFYGILYVGYVFNLYTMGDKIYYLDTV